MAGRRRVAGEHRRTPNYTGPSSIILIFPIDLLPANIIFVHFPFQLMNFTIGRWCPIDLKTVQ